MENNNQENKGTSSYFNSGNEKAKIQFDHEEKKLKIQVEQEIRAKEMEHEKEKIKIENEHNRTIADKELGSIGRIFGGHKLLPLNISALLILILLIVGCLFTFFGNCTWCSSTISLTVKEFWGIVTPIITLTLGYIFGKNQSNS